MFTQIAAMQSALRHVIRAPLQAVLEAFQTSFGIGHHHGQMIKAVG
jgi:hypothetical protein